MSDVDSFDIDMQPSWLPQRMPQLNSHIKIVVSKPMDLALHHRILALDQAVAGLAWLSATSCT